MDDSTDDVRDTSSEKTADKCMNDMLNNSVSQSETTGREPHFLLSSRRLFTANTLCDGKPGDIQIYLGNNGCMFGFYPLSCSNLTIEGFTEKLNKLNQLVSRRDTLHLQPGLEYDPLARYENEFVLPNLPFTFVHLYEAPSREVLEKLSELSHSTTTDSAFNDIYSALAITMELFCETKPYNVILKSSVVGKESPIKLNPSDLLLNSRFQNNLVRIKHSCDLAKFLANVANEIKDFFQHASEAILNFEPGCGPSEPEWDHFMNDREGFQFKLFRTEYNIWIKQNFKENQWSTICIGDNEKSKSFKKAKQVMLERAALHVQELSAVPSLNLGLDEFYCRKQMKHLRPFFFMLDFRRNRKPAVPEELFEFNGEGMLLFEKHHSTILEVKVHPITMDGKKVYWDENDVEIYNVHQTSLPLLQLCLGINFLLSSFKSVPILTLLFAELSRKELLSLDENKYEWVYKSGAMIIDELNARYKLDVRLTSNEMGLDLQWDDLSSSPGLEVEKDILRLFRWLMSVTIVDKEVKQKVGKKRCSQRVKKSFQHVTDVFNDNTWIHGLLPKRYFEGKLCKVYSLSNARHAAIRNLGIDYRVNWAHQLLRRKFTLGKLIYVVLQDRSIRFALEAYDASTRIANRLTHSQIANMGPVYDAGELFFNRIGEEHWALVKVNNSSGHYRPQPEDGLQGVKHIMEELFAGNPNFSVHPDCTLVNALSSTRLSIVDESTQILGSNF